MRRPRSRHDPGQVLVALAVAVADGAESISDIAVLADQAELFGPVASDSTCWLVLDAISGFELATARIARVRGRLGATRGGHGIGGTVGVGGGPGAAWAGDRP